MKAAEAARILIAEVSTPLLPVFLGEVGPWLSLAMEAVERGEPLSSGELILIGAVHALWNGGGNLRLAELSRLDHGRQQLVMAVWLLTYGGAERDPELERTMKSIVGTRRRDRVR